MNDVLLMDNLNETELKYEKNKTTSLDLYNMLFKKSNYNITNKFKFDSSSQLEKSQWISLQDEMLAEIKARKEKIRMELLINKLTKELAIELKYFSVDSSEISSSERKIMDIQDKYSFRILGEVLQNIYLQYNDYPNVLAGICKGLSRFELQEVSPWGPTMLSGLLGHKNETVKEYAVSLIENWSDVGLLPILRNIDCHSMWLKDYITDVVSYLEECDAIHKKII